ncbi:MAG TPA: AAA family ATPase [Anaeromyxobacteraceae bacterium]|nr:AAA family ATPase [Anaeromyxobacteraceae bacterium]
MNESFEALRRFFETAEVARKAARPLSDEAEVALVLDGGQARFVMRGGKPAVLEGPAEAPDFTLTLPDRAVARITALKSDEVGEFGIEFFKLMLEKDPALKLRAKIDAPTARLLAHGYLGVLAQGGLRVTWWLIKNGVKNPKAAIEQLRGGK